MNDNHSKGGGVILNPPQKKHSANIDGIIWTITAGADAFIKTARAWCLTIYNEPNEPIIYDAKQMQYLIFGSEICPTTKRHHFQTYVYFYNCKTFSQVREYFRKRLNKYPHICKSNGTNKQNIAYCSKDEEYIEYGEEPTDTGGNTNNLKNVIKLLEKKEITIEKICREQPEFYHMYGRTLRDAQTPRDFLTTCEWYYGKAGTGKTKAASKRAKEEYNSHMFLNVKDWARGWVSNYDGQECIIINELRGDQIQYNDLLELIDCNEYNVSVRNIGSIPFTSKHIIITSPLMPHQVFKNRHKMDSLEQLMRRISIYDITCGECNTEESEIIRTIIHKADPFNINRKFKITDKEKLINIHTVNNNNDDEMTLDKALIILKNKGRKGLKDIYMNHIEFYKINRQVLNDFFMFED